MTTAKIERRGDVQRVQLPAGFQFDADEVEILRRGDEVVLRKPRPNLREAFDLLAGMPEDFFAEPCEDPPPQQRDPL
jgi:antitoxin VapB